MSRALLGAAVALAAVASCALPSLQSGPGTTATASGGAGQSLSASAVVGSSTGASSSAGGSGSGGSTPSEVEPSWAVGVRSTGSVIATSAMAIDGDVVVAFDVAGTNQFEAQGCPVQGLSGDGVVLARFAGTNGACQWTNVYQGARNAHLTQRGGHILMVAAVDVNLVHLCTDGGVNHGKGTSLIAIVPAGKTGGECILTASKQLSANVFSESASLNSIQVLVGGIRDDGHGNVEASDAMGGAMHQLDFGAIDNIVVAGPLSAAKTYAAVTFDATLNVLGQDFMPSGLQNGLVFATDDNLQPLAWATPLGDGRVEAMAYNATGQFLAIGGASANAPTIWPVNGAGMLYPKVSLVGASDGGVHAIDAGYSAYVRAGGSFTGSITAGGKIIDSSGADGFVWALDKSLQTQWFATITDDHGGDQSVTALCMSLSGITFAAGTTQHPARFGPNLVLADGTAFVARYAVKP